MKISIIAAIDEGRALGKDNKLLWHIPEDFKRFKELTSGHVILMGYNTYLSIGKPLPNRTNIVVNMDTEWKEEGVVVCHNLEEALEKAKEIEEKNNGENG
jgi:dihydrofolate reductase